MDKTTKKMLDEIYKKIDVLKLLFGYSFESIEKNGTSKIIIQNKQGIIISSLEVDNDDKNSLQKILDMINSILLGSNYGN